MPFPNNTFEYAYGGCYLEETVDFRELYRVLKPGARANLFGCGELFADYQVVEMMARAAGFKISRHLKFDHEDDHVSEMCQPYHEASSRQDPGNYSTYKPMIIYKPKEATQ